MNMNRGHPQGGPPGAPMGAQMGIPPEVMQQMMRDGIDPQMFMQFVQTQQGGMGMSGAPKMAGGGTGGNAGGRGAQGPGAQKHGTGDNRGGGVDRGGPGGNGGPGGPGRNQADGSAEQLSGQKRPLSDISNEQQELVPGTLLKNESAEIDIKEDYFFAGPYKQERKLLFDVEHIIEAAEMKEELTVGDRTGKPHMCTWHAKGACKTGYKCPMRHQRVKRTDVCKHWLRSQCKKGDMCEYLHQYDMKRMPLCHFFAEGQCTKDDCQFLHIRPEDKVVECPWYARGFCKHGPKCRKKHARKTVCGSYMAGFCPKGPACPLGHPKWELPTEQVGEGESKEAGTTVTSIRCHNCNEMGHKASQCPYATNTPAGPAGRTPQQGEQQTFNGKVTAVKEGFCFMESRPGESNVYIPAQIADPSLIMQGDVVTVRAHWNQRNNNWRAFGECIRDGKPIPARDMNSAAFGSGESPVGAGGQAGRPGGGPGGQGGATVAAKTGWMTNYKTKICKNWQQGTCQYGQKCTFAHGEHELGGPPGGGGAGAGGGGGGGGGMPPGGGYGGPPPPGYGAPQHQQPQQQPFW